MALSSVLAFSSSIFNKTYIRDQSIISYWVMNKTESALFSMLEEHEVDISRNWYESEIKNNFLNSFSWWTLNLDSSDSEYNSFSCYNYSVSDSIITHHSEVDISSDIYIEPWVNDYIYIDNYWEPWWTELLWLICYYNTLDYIGSNDSISLDDSPLNYVLFTFFEDLKMWNRILQKKWTLYFN